METAISQSPRNSIQPERAQVDTPRPALLDDPRSKRILAKTIYRELKESGLAERDVLSIATELLGLVADDLRTTDRTS